MKFSEIPYQRIDLEAASKECRELAKEAVHAASGEEQFELHQKFNTLCDHVYTVMVVAKIRRDGNTEDAFYEQENAYYDQEIPNFQAAQNEYLEAFIKTPYRAYMEEKIGSAAVRSIELTIKSFDAKLIPLLQEENSLMTRYAKLMASAAIDWKGETLNLSLLQKYMTGNDRSVREEAFEKYSGFFEAHEAELDEIYDALVKNRTAQARALGMDTYTELGYWRMNRNSYGQEQVKQLRDQIKNVYVPFAEKMHENRRKQIGVEKLRYFDEGVFFAQGNPKPCGTPEEILQSGQKMYGELSDETREFFDFMMQNDLFDVLGRKKKKTGGYMEELSDYKEPFIYANFNGTSGDVDVITHECGHAFQYYVSAADPIRDHNKYLTMETAEIHSMSMEFFTDRWMELFFADRAEDYRQMHLEDAIAFIPYGCMVDEFQHIAYDYPELTPAQRKEAWLKLEQEYRPHVDYTGNRFLQSGGFWQKQLHIFEHPFYYIDYVLAQLCAFQYHIMMKKDYKEAWDSYLKLCKLSASKLYPELLREAGLKVPFEEGCIAGIVAELERELV